MDFQSASAGRVEFDFLQRSGALPHGSLHGASLAMEGTPIYDAFFEEVLFERVALRSGTLQLGYADFGINPLVGSLLPSVTFGLEWDEAYLTRKALEEASKKGVKYDDARCRFIMYSFPRVAMEVSDGRKTVTFDALTFSPIPAESDLVGFIPSF